MQQTLFVSCEDIDGSDAAEFIAALRAQGCHVLHSPRNPSRGDDPRWKHWYANTLREEVSQAEIFVIVINSVWESATWMGVEGDAGMAARTDGTLRRLCYYDPQNLVQTSKIGLGMQRCLEDALPRDLPGAIAALRIF